MPARGRLDGRRRGVNRCKSVSLSLPITLAGAILSGGRACRYGGAAKGMLQLAGGRTIIDHLADQVRRAGIDQIVLVANDPAPYEACGLEIIPDLHPHEGPLAGVEAALDHYAGRFDAVLVLPCDVPGLTADEITALRSALERSGAPVVTAATGDDEWHPLCALVRTTVLPAVSNAVRNGRRKVTELWRRLGAEVCHFDSESAFCNVNSPEDLSRWQQMESQR